MFCFGKPEMSDSESASADDQAKKTSAASASPSFGMKVTLSGIKTKFSKINHLSTNSLCEMLARNELVWLLDTRPQEEYAVSHLPDSHRIDPELDDKPGFISLIKDRVDGIELVKETPLNIVCYCSLGYRSSVMAERITTALEEAQVKDLSHVNVYNLDGSLFKWANEGRPMVDVNNTPTVFAHPYSAIWGKLLRKELRRKTIESEGKAIESEGNAGAS